MYGTCMVHVWYMYGTCMVHVWYMYGACMVHVCYMYATCMVLVWYMYGTCMVHVWYMYGTCMVHVWSDTVLMQDVHACCCVCGVHRLMITFMRVKRCLRDLPLSSTLQGQGSQSGRHYSQQGTLSEGEHTLDGGSCVLCLDTR